MSRCAALLLLAFSATLHAAIEPAPATVVTDEKPIDSAWVESETLDGVEFYLGDWKSPTRVKVTRKRGQYKEVLYTGNGEDASFMRAEVLFNSPDFAKAPEHYKKATVSAKWNWEIEQAYRRGADALARSNKGAEALEMLKEYVAKYPKNVHMAEVVSLRARLRMGTGDHAGAIADYQEMTKQGKAWSPTAELEGMIGQRSVLVAQKKFADAVALLTPYWAKLKPDPEDPSFGKIGLAVCEDLEADGKIDACIPALKKLYLAPVTTEIQCKARLHHARLLAKANDTEGNLAAFDHAALAALLGADEETQAAAVKLARELIARIDKDKKLSDEVRKDYRAYAASL
jgi:hypothetical protein